MGHVLDIHVAQDAGINPVWLTPALTARWARNCRSDLSLGRCANLVRSQPLETECYILNHAEKRD
jgi:hypothetical protein